MSMFHAEYWKNWGSFGNQTNKAIENQPSGDSAKNLVGNKYDQQTGSSVAVQVGNKSSKQTGWSNSLLEGFSFSTTLGQSTSTTVGASFSNHVGFKWGMFVGPETSINAATSVKVAKGAAYSFDTVTKCETNSQKRELSLKKSTFADEIDDYILDTRLVGTSASAILGKSLDHITGRYTLLSADDIKMSTMQTFNVSSLDVNMLGTKSARLESLASVVIKGFGQATMDAAVIRIG